VRRAGCGAGIVAAEASELVAVEEAVRRGRGAGAGAGIAGAGSLELVAVEEAVRRVGRGAGRGAGIVGAGSSELVAPGGTEGTASVRRVRRDVRPVSV
jgi:hypothetical protein